MFTELLLFSLWLSASCGYVQMEVRKLQCFAVQYRGSQACAARERMAKDMHAKENFLRIINFNQPERILSSLPVYSLSYQGCHHETYSGEGGDDSPVGYRWVDIWGTEWHKIHAGVMGMPVGNPLADMSALRSYLWPSADDERIYSKIYRQLADFPGDDLLLGAWHRDTLWEKAYMLVGMENLMAYFLTEPEYAREVLHRIMDFQIEIARHYLEAGIEIVFMGDDLGTQSGALLGPRIVNDFLAPEYRRLFEIYTSRGIYVSFHSCGKIASVLDLLFELGVNLLNPVQASANDLDAVRLATQGRMALHGGISSAILMEGPIERIIAEVRRRMWQLGRQGGYICAQDQGMPYPDAHLQALKQAVEDYGRYPLTPPDSSV